MSVSSVNKQRERISTWIDFLFHINPLYQWRITTLSLKLIPLYSLLFSLFPLIISSRSVFVLFRFHVKWLFQSLRLLVDTTSASMILELFSDTFWKLDIVTMIDNTLSQNSISFEELIKESLKESIIRSHIIIHVS